MTTHLHIIGVQFSSFTRAVQFCCEEIGISYTLGMQYNSLQYELRGDLLKTINPFGKVPVLIHHDKALYETQAICRYLDNHFNRARLQPTDSWLGAQVDQWCAAISFYVDKAVVRNYLLEFRFPKGPEGSVREDVIAAAIPEIKIIIAILEQQLGTKDFLVADQFTLADIILAPALHYLSISPNNHQLIDEDSALRPYIARIIARPSAKAVFI